MNRRHIRLGREWLQSYFGRDVLTHYGVKGMKWGVRRTPEQLGHKKLTKSSKHATIKVYGHSGSSKNGKPNSIVDHISDDGTVKARSFYNSDGWKVIEIHTSNHGNPKHHPFGTKGEHIHYYEWDCKNGRRLSSNKEEIPTKIREENDDIL